MNKIVTSENIQAILAAGESDTVEFKTKVRSSIHVLPKIIMHLQIQTVES